MDNSTSIIESTINKSWDPFEVLLYDTSMDNDSLDLSYMDLVDYNEHLREAEKKNDSEKILNLLLNNNLIKEINTFNLNRFNQLETIDFSFNYIEFIPDELNKLKNLRVLILKENALHDNSFGKKILDNFKKLEILNLSGNSLTQFPYQLLAMESLKEIYLGANKIKILPKNYDKLVNSLELLYLGGNLIQNVPEELSQLTKLKTLNLSDNRISNLPATLARLRNLKSLALHNNSLTTLPIQLVKLNLAELSLRNNPLVGRFVRDLNYTVPSLLELCGRSIKTNNVSYANYLLPKNLVDYLNSAHCCVNPKCRGVYFTSKVEHVKFVDFCGKYRVPLMVNKKSIIIF
jgi:Leucine-rich repeat (LRR) protein